MLFSPAPMHIPDGFLSGPVAVLLWLLSAAVIGLALRKTNHSLSERDVPLMGVLAAAIFAGQMLNFTVIGGTSGHLLGAALAAILLGPWPAVLVMTSVVSVQALLFQDGGLLALGGNLFNMAVIGVGVSYAVYHALRKLTRGGRTGTLAAGFAAAWASIFIASLSAGLQLALSGTTPANLAVPAMGGIHALIGIGEGLITVGALAFLSAARRDLLQPESAPLDRPAWLGGLLIAVILAALSPLASAYPDGLEWVAEKYQFLSAAREPVFNLIPDYILPGVPNEDLATILAGLLGLLAAGGVAAAVAANRRKSGRSSAA